MIKVGDIVDYHPNAERERTIPAIVLDVWPDEYAQSTPGYNILLFGYDYDRNQRDGFIRYSVRGFASFEGWIEPHD